MDVDYFPRNVGRSCCPFPETTYSWNGGSARYIANDHSLLLDCPVKGNVVFSMAVSQKAGPVNDLAHCRPFSVEPLYMIGTAR